MRAISFLILLAAVTIAGSCKLQSPAEEQNRPEGARNFPKPFRPVSEIIGTEFSTEDKRDAKGEAETVMDWAGIKAGMTVADIGAGEGYYTVRLAARVGQKGRVLAQDINRGALDRLGERVSRERLDNVAIKEGDIIDPKLPADSFDRVFMVHMYHEVTEPYAFVWNMWPALKEGGEVIIVDRDAPTDQHGIPPKLLFCEMDALGFRLKDFTERLEVGGYFARFVRGKNRPDPATIKACSEQA